MKARYLQEGHVLVDPDGHLYEVKAIIEDIENATIYVWLWPDSSPVPNFFQVFEPDDEIVSINQKPKPSDAQTEVIPVVSD